MRNAINPENCATKKNAKYNIALRIFKIIEQASLLITESGLLKCSDLFADNESQWHDRGLQSENSLEFKIIFLIFI